METVDDLPDIFLLSHPNQDTSWCDGCPRQAFFESSSSTHLYRETRADKGQLVQGGLEALWKDLEAESQER
eukprot:2299023-Prorocentrum_lima.AAC.1